MVSAQAREARRASAHPLIRQIRTRRLAAGRNLTEVAIAAGLAATTVCEIEQGNHSPRLVTLERLASAVGLDVALLDLAQMREQLQLHQFVEEFLACACDGWGSAGDLPRDRESHADHVLDVLGLGAVADGGR